MKKISTIILLFALSFSSLVSCRSSKQTKDTGILGGAGGSIGKTVMTVVGAIVLAKIIQAVLKTVSGSTAYAPLVTNNQVSLSNVSETTPLSQLASNDVMKTALQVLVADRFQIPLTTVASNYKSLATVGDLANFIGRNASAASLADLK